MIRLQALMTSAALVALLSLGGCASTGAPGVATASLAPAADPVLPDAVSQVPSASGVSGDEEDGMRSLAHEVEEGATPKRLKKKRLADATGPVNAMQAEETQVADAADVFPATPTEPQSSAAVVASLAPTQSPELPALAASQAEAEPVAKVRGVAPTKPAPDARVTQTGSVAARSSELDDLIAHYADYYDVPEELVRRVAKRESTFNPRAKNGPYLGLMQISLATARGMGYRGGREGLLDAETNLKYAVRYLRGAFIVAGGNHNKADKLYQIGYYYHAKRAGLLSETGLGVDRRRRGA